MVGGGVVGKEMRGGVWGKEMRRMVWDERGGAFN